MLMSSGPFTLRKFKEHSVATAFAMSVFPVPGGPYRHTPYLLEIHPKSTLPDLFRIPSAKSDGYCNGNWIVSKISFLASPSPPTSSQDTLGIFSI
jgi:hypothetical protein